jgi:hypothetical protein
MRLTLSGRHPRNSAYVSETGQILYKVHKPRQFGPGTATIRKAVGTVHGVWEGDSNELVERRVKSSFSEKPEDSTDKRDDGGAGHGSSVDRGLDDSDLEDEAEPSDAGPAFEGHFAFYAQVEFRAFEATRFRYNGFDVSVNDFFRKEGWSLWGR